jgi:hypothetical protein
VGLFDAITGRRKVKGPAPDRLFAITTAHITLDTEHGIKSRGAAAIVFQPLDTGAFEQIARDMEELVRGTGDETGSTIETEADSMGYRWMIVRDDDVEDLAVGINAVSEQLAIEGYGDRLLCAVFGFQDTQGAAMYFIYNYKRGTWYPFVPADGEQKRATERELRLKAVLAADLPIEPELDRWFPLWDIPI